MNWSLKSGSGDKKWVPINEEPHTGVSGAICNHSFAGKKGKSLADVYLLVITPTRSQSSYTGQLEQIGLVGRQTF